MGRNRPGRLIRGAAVLAATLCATLGAAQVPARAQSAAAPTLVPGERRVVVGDTLTLHGAGWPPRSLVRIVVCGNAAMRGSADCAERQARTVFPKTNGTFTASLVVPNPPAPCPCVLRARTPRGPEDVTVPISIVGVVPAPVPSTSPPAGDEPLVAVHARVTGHGPFAALFGGRPARTLVAEIHNRGDQTVDPVMTLVWGRPGRASHAFTPPPIGAIAPGERRRIEVPFELGPASFGGYEVNGEATGAGAPVRFAASTSAYPWGAFAVLAVVLAVAVLLVVRRARSRLRVAVPPAAPAAPRPVVVHFLAAGAVLDESGVRAPPEPATPAVSKHVPAPWGRWWPLGPSTASGPRGEPCRVRANRVRSRTGCSLSVGSDEDTCGAPASAGAPSRPDSTGT